MKPLSTRRHLMHGLLALLLLIPLSVSAIPQTLGYQGYLTDSSGTPLDGSQSLVFQLYNVSSGGSALWQETQGTVTVTNGLFTVKLGNSTPFPVDLFSTPLWLGVSVNGDPEMTPRTRLSSDGYAFRAEDADRLEGMSAASLDQSDHVANMANPHGVTAAQTGAASAVSLSAHTGDTGNPHNVSAAQTGAVDSATFGSHTGNSAAHHAPYTDPRSIAAMGTKGPSNPLNHDRYANTEAVAAIKAAGGAGSALDADLVDGLHASELIDAAQDEVRIPINALPFVINTPGSYYLTGDLTATGANGITVNASDTTIDLMGYTIRGDGSSNAFGIYISAQENVTILNGTVRGFGSSGIFQGFSSVRFIRVLDVRALGNGVHGIMLFGSNNLIVRCVAGDNGNYGLYAGESSRLLDNTAYNSGGTYGIYGGTGSLLTGNTAFGNQKRGISGGRGSSIVGNTVYKNTGDYGIYADFGATVSGNTAYNNQSWGIYVNSHSLVTDNTIYENNLSNTAGRGGLYVSSSNQVRNNILSRNQQYNLYVGLSGNAIEENMVANSNIGIRFNSTGNFYTNNRAAGNTVNFQNIGGQTDGGGNVQF